MPNILAKRSEIPNEDESRLYQDSRGYLYSLSPEIDPFYLKRPLITERKPKSSFYMDPDELILRQAYMESVFNPNAVNTDTGPVGMFQIMPANIEAYQRATGDIGDPLDPNYNRKMRDWFWDRFGKTQLVSREQPEEVKLAKQLAAYNWKIKDLSEILVDLRSQGKDIYSDNSWMDDPRVPKETRDYINFILFHKPTKYRSDEELEKLKYKYDEAYSNRGTK